MIIVGVDIVAKVVTKEVAGAKVVFNRAGALFFETSRQHREMKAEWISYEDNYRGNAIAAVITADTFEARYHEQYPDEEVANIVREVLSLPELSMYRPQVVTYQGRPLRI